MNIRLSSWSVQHPVPTIVLFAALTIIGLMSAFRLPINAWPSVNFPFVGVTVTQAGATPEDLEKSVTRRIEDAVAGLSGVRHIRSTITEGMSLTEIEFEMHVDSDRAVNDVRNAVTVIRDNLPRTIDEPRIERNNYDMAPLVYYAVESFNMSPAELSEFIDEKVANDLIGVPGVQKVERLGGDSREIQVLLNPEKLIAYGLTVPEVSAELSQINVNVPAGRTKLSGGELLLRVPGNRSSLQELMRIPISLHNGGRVYLKDLGTVNATTAERRTITRLDNREMVGFTVYRSSFASDTHVVDRVMVKVDQLARQYPDVRISKMYDAVTYTRASFSVAMRTLFEGGILTVLVVFLFLRNWRSTLIAGIALPLSVFPVFSVLLFFGMTLNSISLLGLTLVVGFLVDDAIVEIENIEKHLQTGVRPYAAAVEAADSIGLAVMAITATIVAVFLPISFTGGAPGQYLRPFGVTVATAVVASLLVARMVTPLLAAYMLRPAPAGKAPGSKASVLMARYMDTLKWALGHPKIMLVFAALLFSLTAVISMRLSGGFLPKEDISKTSLIITLPPNTTVEQTDRFVVEVTRRIQSKDAVEAVFSTVGFGGDPTKAKLLIRLKSLDYRTQGQEAFESELARELAVFPDSRFEFLNDEGGRDINVLLTGEDFELLEATAEKVRQEMRTVAGIENIHLRGVERSTELRFEPIALEMAKSGVSELTLGSILRIATVGDIEGNLARFTYRDRQVPVRVLLDEKSRNTLGDLENLRVRGDNGLLHPISTLCSVYYGTGTASITRYDRERQISIQADMMLGHTLGAALSAIHELPTMKNLPKGVHSPDGGSVEYMEEMFNQFTMVIATGGMLVCVLMVILFGSFLQPVTILAAVPLSVIGAVVGLLIYGGALDMAAVVAFLMLMGIATKNSILLVDFVIENRRHGVDRTQALLRAGSERARPIVMTSIAMVVGLLPSAFDQGVGANLRAPMASAVIGGLIASTLFSLLFVPVFYALVDDLSRWIQRHLSRLTTVTEQDRQSVK